MARTERLINLVAALLDATRPMSAADIRRRIAGYDQASDEAFRRAFERDKQHLRDLGIPIEAVPTDVFDDTPDAYIIRKERYYLPELDLAPDELAALKMAADALASAGGEAREGFIKLASETGPDGAAGLPMVVGADLATGLALIGPLHEALLERKVVAFGYTTAAGGKPARRTVEPYGLLHKRGAWYLVGLDRDRKEVRSFRVSRMEGEPELLDESYDIPKDFDAVAHLGGEAWEVGPDEVTTAVVRFDAEARWWVEQNMPHVTTRELPEGALEVETPVGNLDALVSWVLGFGDQVEIVAPEQARARLLEHLAPYLAGETP